MNLKQRLLTLCTLALCLATHWKDPSALAAETTGKPQVSRPNIVLIYVDDLGYGDISCNGATLVKTPHVDRLAREGLNFSDGHSPSATCTPSRYAMLTGEYAWRKKGQVFSRGMQS